MTTFRDDSEYLPMIVLQYNIFELPCHPCPNMRQHQCTEPQIWCWLMGMVCSSSHAWKLWYFGEHQKKRLANGSSAPKYVVRWVVSEVLTQHQLSAAKILEKRHLQPAMSSVLPGSSSSPSPPAPASKVPFKHGFYQSQDQWGSHIFFIPKMPRSISFLGSNTTWHILYYITILVLRGKYYIPKMGMVFIEAIPKKKKGDDLRMATAKRVNPTGFEKTGAPKNVW